MAATREITDPKLVLLNEILLKMDAASMTVNHPKHSELHSKNDDGFHCGLKWVKERDGFHLHTAIETFIPATSSREIARLFPSKLLSFLRFVENRKAVTVICDQDISLAALKEILGSKKSLDEIPVTTVSAPRPGRRGCIVS